MCQRRCQAPADWFVVGAGVTLAKTCVGEAMRMPLALVALAGSVACHEPGPTGRYWEMRPGRFHVEAFGRQRLDAVDAWHSYAKLACLRWGAYDADAPAISKANTTFWASGIITCEAASRGGPGD